MHEDVDGGGEIINGILTMSTHLQRVAGFISLQERRMREEQNEGQLGSEWGPREMDSVRSTPKTLN